MSADAIKTVSEAIQKKLENALKDAKPPISGSVHVGPLDDDNTETDAIVLFLYRIAINASLRNTEHRVPANKAGDPPVVFRDSTPLDLYYLLTAGTSETGGEPEALRTLGYAIRALNDEPDLVGIAAGGETVRLSIDPVSTEELSRIWTLFPTANYRTSVVYLASPVWIDPPIERAVAPAVRSEAYRSPPPRAA